DRARRGCDRRARGTPTCATTDKTINRTALWPAGPVRAGMIPLGLQCLVERGVQIAYLQGAVDDAAVAAYPKQVRQAVDAVEGRQRAIETASVRGRLEQVNAGDLGLPQKGVGGSRRVI